MFENRPSDFTGAAQGNAPPFAETDAFDIYPRVPIVAKIAAILVDDLDHPEVRRAVAAAAEHDKIELSARFGILRAQSTGSGLKTRALEAPGFAQQAHPMKERLTISGSDVKFGNFQMQVVSFAALVQ